MDKILSYSIEGDFIGMPKEKKEYVPIYEQQKMANIDFDSLLEIS